MTRRDLIVVGALAATVLALTASVWAFPGRVFFNHGDLYTYHWPLRHHTAAALIEGRLPFWNPYVMLGVPHAANPQAALFYPAGILGFLFPVMTALAWDQILHLLWAALGAFLLVRFARLPRAAAAALAAAYAFSPFLIYRVTAGIPTLVASISWIPWVWLAWLSGSASFLAAVFALQFFSGHPQFLMINAVAMGLWAAASPSNGAWKGPALRLGRRLVVGRAGRWRSPRFSGCRRLSCCAAPAAPAGRNNLGPPIPCVPKTCCCGCPPGSSARLSTEAGRTRPPYFMRAAACGLDA